jgi:3',5'-cyclic AMP phosphodiesterase CpdA
VIDAVGTIDPDVVAVSGDLTQHATTAEFEQARAFIEQLPAASGARIVVPGNHDLSFYNPLRRVVQRLRLYKQHISTDLEPFYEDDEVAVLGLNTARVPLFRGGRFSAAQIQKVETRMRGVSERVTRVLVTHHPFDLPSSYPAGELVRGARSAVKCLLANIDVLLAGHHHMSHSGATATRYAVEGYSAAFVQAGTALSSRVRGERNSFNVLRLGDAAMSVEVWIWNPGTKVFARGAVSTFRREPGGWAAAAGTSLVAPAEP